MSSNDRKALKKKAKKSVKSHYFRNLILVFIAGLIMSGGYHYVTGFNTDTVNGIHINSSSNSSIREDFETVIKEEVDNLKDDEEEKKFGTDGVLSVFANQIENSGSFVYGFINALNELLAKGRVETIVIILISSLVSLIFYMLIENVIVVGKNRYFLEQRRYRETKLDKLLFPYKARRTLHLAYILFIKYIYQLLWSLTIIGGIIKHYEYKMIPYLLAENPNMSKKEVFALSKELSYKNKWNLFKLDVSFIGWKLLELLTFNLSSIFYFDIYKECVYAEVYFKLRENVNSPLLNDEALLVDEITNSEYPINKYKITLKKREWLKLDYNKNYDVLTYIMFFFTFSMVGWIYEVFIALIHEGIFANRGTLFGPWLPIYGFGGVLILILLKRFRDKPHILFLMAFILCGLIEYTTAWYLETFKHLKWWDYSGYFLNIQGRICLEGLIVFGLGGCLVTYVVAPLLSNIYKKIPIKVKTGLCLVLVLLFSFDFVYSSKNPNVGQGITTNVFIYPRRV